MEDKQVVDWGELETLYNSMQPHKKAFLDAYAEMGVIKHTAEGIGISEFTVHLWKRTDDTFRQLFELANDAFTQRLELELYKRAMGIEKAKMSDVLLMFALKARKPEVYREKVPEIPIKGDITIRLAIPRPNYDQVDTETGSDQKVLEGDFIELPEGKEGNSP